MVVAPVPFRLKDGREAVLRCLAAKDAEALLENYTKCVGETDFLLTSPEDLKDFTVDAEREYAAQLELTFIEGNSRARALYEKMGFRVVGVHPDAIRLADSAFKSEYLMSRKIDRSIAD